MSSPSGLSCQSQACQPLNALDGHPGDLPSSPDQLEPSSVVLDYREFTELMGMAGNDAILPPSDRRQERLDFNYPETEEQLDLW